MPSSTSNSNDRLPVGRWGSTWAVAVVLALLLVAAAEYRLRSQGYAPSMADSAELWAQQRVQVDLAPGSPVVALGASRIQLGLDLAMLEQRADTSALQLAIDGSSFVPVLQQLASAEAFTGTVLVSVNEAILQEPWREDKARQWVAVYTAMAQRLKFNPFPLWEARLATFLNSHLALRTEGAPPYVILQREIAQPGLYRSYLTTLGTRERRGDYTLVAQPQFYAGRVMRHFGDQPVVNGRVSYAEFETAYSTAIAQLQPLDETRFLAVLEEIMEATAAIEQRSGRVIFVRFPSDKLVWEIDRRRYPREKFWRRLAARHSRTIHFKDYGELDRYSLPDGSHLDMRDRMAFTAALADIIEHEFGWQ